MKTIIVVAIIALVLIWVISSYNRLIRLNVSVDEAFAQIEVQLKRRADLIPNLVETVKGYASHEKSTLDAVVAARAKATSATTIGDVAAADGQLTTALRGLLAVTENYPDLKASANFRISCLWFSPHNYPLFSFRLRADLQNQSHPVIYLPRPTLS